MNKQVTKKVVATFTSVATVVLTTGGVFMPIAAGAQLQPPPAYCYEWNTGVGGSPIAPRAVAASGPRIFVFDRSATGGLLHYIESGSGAATAASALQALSPGNATGAFGTGQVDVASLYSTDTDLQLDASGDLFVADPGNSRVLRYQTNGVFLGNTDMSALNPSRATEIAGGIGLGGGASLLVVDPNQQRVYRIDSYITPTSTTQFPNYGTGVGQWNDAHSVVKEKTTGNVYIAGGAVRKVVKYTETGTYITEWPLNPSGNYRSMSMDYANNLLYIADSQNGIISVYDLNGNLVTQWGGIGTGPGLFDLSGPSPALSVGHDQQGGVYVADSTRIQKFGNCPVPTPTPTPTPTPPPNPGPVCDANGLGIWNIQNANFVYDVVAPSNQSYFYVMARDASNVVRIEKYSKSLSGGAPLSSFPTNTPLKFFDVSPATGEFFILDSANLRVQVLDSAGSPVRSFGAGDITSGANGVKLSQDGALAFVSHGNTGGSNTGNVRVFDATSGVYIGQMNGQAMNGNANATMNYAGYFFTVESGTNRVDMFDSTRNFVEEWTPAVSNAIGVALNDNNQVYVIGATTDVVTKYDGTIDSHTLLASWSPNGLPTKGIDVDDSNNDVYVVTGSGGVWSAYRFGCTPPTPTPTATPPPTLCLAKPGKVCICHYPDGNPENVQVIEVSSNAVKAHMKHGDDTFNELTQVCDIPVELVDSGSSSGSFLALAAAALAAGLGVGIYARRRA